MTCIGLHLGRRAGRHRAFSLVELLVVIAIVGLLIALLLPAVQAAREAARRVQCKNHLKQLAFGCILHQEEHGHFPTGGWQTHWLCDPDRGFSNRQPGSWGYNVLPYIEQQPLHDLGKGTTGEEKLGLNKQRIETPLSIFHCPSRRPARTYAVGAFQWPLSSRFSAPFKHQALTDYAANGGAVYGANGVIQWTHGPRTLEEGDSGRFHWEDLSWMGGIIYTRSEVRLSDVADGSSNTYLIGEKQLSVFAYDPKIGASTEDWNIADRNSVFSGDFHSLVRFADAPNWLDENGKPFSQPRSDADHGDPIDESGFASWFYSFGSAHAGGFHMSFCDGSVRTINYDLDYETHRRLAHREDNLPINYSSVE